MHPPTLLRRFSRRGIAAAFCLVGPTGASAQAAAEDYAFLVGSWEGVLEYLDYGDDRTRIQLPTALEARKDDSTGVIVLQFMYEEPDERIVTSEERLTATSDGVYLGALWQVEENTSDTDAHSYRVALVRQGEDNGRSASLRNVVVREADSLTITTWVTYEGTTAALQRHQYRLHRVRRGLATVLDALEGSWAGTGTLLGRAGEFRMEWTSRPQGFVRLTFSNAWVSETGETTPVLSAEATYLVRGSGAVGVWVDTRPQQLTLSATLTDSTIVTEWTADSERGRTEYLVRGADEVVVRDFVVVEGSYRPFGEATYHREGPTAPR